MMSNWKADPVYQGVFEEIEALWADLDPSVRPLLFRVEERTPKTSWDGPTTRGPVLRVWLYDDAGARLTPFLRKVEHDFGETRGEFSLYGLVKFAIEGDQSVLILGFQLGPEIKGELTYDIEVDGAEVRLMAHSGTAY